jgi:hypothetical protein
MGPKIQTNLTRYLNADDWMPDDAFMPELLPNKGELDFVGDPTLPPQADEEAQAASSTGPSVAKPKKSPRKTKKL